MDEYEGWYVCNAGSGIYDQIDFGDGPGNGDGNNAAYMEEEDAGDNTGCGDYEGTVHGNGNTFDKTWLETYYYG